jgi:hypothetical protein
MNRPIDRARVEAALEGADVATLRRWEETLGLPVGAWPACSSLRIVVVAVAAYRVAAGIPAARGNALAEACETLGIEDDGEGKTRPSDNLQRTVNGWLANAYPPDATSGKIVRSSRRRSA